MEKGREREHMYRHFMKYAFEERKVVETLLKMGWDFYSCREMGQDCVFRRNPWWNIATILINTEVFKNTSDVFL